jgi:hypothetical protein
MRREAASALVGEPSRSSSTGQRVWDKATIVAAIQRWNEWRGEPPKSTEWIKKQDGYPTMSTVINHFGTWSAAIVAAGFEPRRSGGQPGVSLGAAAPVRSWNRDEIIDEIGRWAEEHGYPPTRRDWMLATVEHPNYAMAVKVCGSWADAVESAGFPRPTRGTRSKAGRARGTRKEVSLSSVPAPPRADLAAVREAALSAVNAMFDLLDQVGRAVT